MKNQIIYILVFFFGTIISGCDNKSAENKLTEKTEEESEHKEEGMGVLHLSHLKFESLGIKVDSLPSRSLSGIVEANGQLEVPPQHEATVTGILGANVTSIKVIEGDKVRKGEVLAFLSHPNLANLQSNYIQAYSQFQYLEKEMQRQKRLYEEEVGSGKDYQQTLANYQAVKGEIKGYEAQLKQLSLNIESIKEGEIYQYVPVISPINGYIEKVKVQIGQYVEPQTEMFMIVNTEHVHADLMVFEKDVHKVEVGQEIKFSVATVPGSNLSAKIYSVGKKFEQNPKAVHVHAEIEQKKNFLIPGMYINAKIETSKEKVMALPEEAIIEEEGKPYIFLAEKLQKDGETEWAFQAVEIRTGMKADGWVEIKLLESLPAGALVAWSDAYYLISEMNKSKASHGH
ncbi:efflux RND transporter periplasmic adaptor subunit [uncultured Marivirga sp.]|uniref:efflux RND transporter periplasmic adaptor subunit n=1 Tax=uncultured Marivirga sp. TaxID=1123707 RepID=UPI0030EF4E05|tara:strand:+ start:13818 stop:15017 length:1200 start_codon:yes stop_codon:yes gene_type:complete